MKLLLYVLIAAGAVWIASELLEVMWGGRTPLTLWLTALFHLLMAAGIWGACLGQAGPRGILGLVAAGMASAGYLLLVYPPLAVSRSPTLTIGEYIAASPVFGFAGLLAVVGTILFGIAMLRRSSYRPWTGIVLVLTPAIFAATMASRGPELVAITANVVQGVAWIAIARQALRSARRNRPDLAVTPA